MWNLPDDYGNGWQYCRKHNIRYHLSDRYCDACLSEEGQTQDNYLSMLDTLFEDYKNLQGMLIDSINSEELLSLQDLHDKVEQLLMRLVPIAGITPINAPINIDNPETFMQWRITRSDIDIPHAFRCVRFMESLYFLKGRKFKVKYDCADAIIYLA